MRAPHRIPGGRCKGGRRPGLGREKLKQETKTDKICGWLLSSYMMSKSEDSDFETRSAVTRPARSGDAASPAETDRAYDR